MPRPHISALSSTGLSLKNSGGWYCTSSTPSCSAFLRCLVVCRKNLAEIEWIFTDIHGCLQIFIDSYIHLQMLTDIYKYVQINIFTDIYRHLQIFADIYRYLQIFTDIYRCSQISINFEVQRRVCSGLVPERQGRTFGAEILVCRY